MSKDIYIDRDGVLQVADTDVYKGENILNIQVGILIYAPALGIDLARFIDTDYAIQNETFKAYTLDQLINQGISIEALGDMSDKLSQNLEYIVGQNERV